LLFGKSLIYSTLLIAHEFLRSIVLTPGQKETIVPQADLQIKNAALGEQLSDGSGRTTIKFTYHNPANNDDDEDEDDEDDNEPQEAELTTVLCSLTPGKVSDTVFDVSPYSSRRLMCRSSID